MSIWLIDRSRISRGDDHCMTARYWGYHYGGYGIQLAKPALDPNIGIAVHGVLAGWTEVGKPLNGIVETLWVKRIGAICAKRSENQHTTTESCFLVSALSHGWWQMFSSWLFENFEVVAVEREFLMELDDGRIGLMVKPDLVLRAKATKALTIMDWKTFSTFNAESTPAQFRDSVQLALMTAVVEESLGEPVESFWIAGMLKGQRKYFERDKGEMKTPERRVYSHLLYANPPQHPFKPNWSTNGYWYNKQPVWDHMSAEQWVQLLKVSEPELLREMFPMMGPFPRQTQMIPQALRGIVAGENRIIDALWKLNDGADPVDLFSRSYGNCTSYYGEECPFYRLCYGLQGSDDPLGSGLYKVRRPHHEPELEQMKALGIEIPPEPWETTG